MEKVAELSTGLRFLVTAAAFVIVIAGMQAAESILVPFLIAVFIAVLCAPPLFWLQKKNVPAVLSMLIIVLVAIVIGVAIMTLVGTSLNDFSQALPSYQASLREKVAGFLELLEGMGIDIYKEGLIKALDPGFAMKLVANLLTRLGSVLTNSFMILLTVIFILLEASGFPAKLRAISDNPDVSFGHFEKFIKNINRYIAIKTLTSLATGIAIAVWLKLLGVNHSLLWGLLAFLLNYVPNIGSVIAAVPAMLLALIQLGSGSALLAGLGYAVVNVIIGSIIEPKIMGRGLGLSTLVVFLSLVFWGWVLGPVGMLLSVPLTMTVKIALDSNEDTRRIAILLGSDRSIRNVLQAEHSGPGKEKPDSERII